MNKAITYQNFQKSSFANMDTPVFVGWPPKKFRFQGSHPYNFLVNYFDLGYFLGVSPYRMVMGHGKTENFPERVCYIRKSWLPQKVHTQLIAVSINPKKYLILTIVQLVYMIAIF